jgi:glutathione S-transferase
MSTGFAVQLWTALDEANPKSGMETRKGVVEQKNADFFATLDILDKHLARRAFLSGDYSVADTLATPLLDMLDMIKGIELEAYPHVISWRDRLRSRPSYKGVWPHEKEIK